MFRSTWLNIMDTDIIFNIFNTVWFSPALKDKTSEHFRQIPPESGENIQTRCHLNRAPYISANIRPTTSRVLQYTIRLSIP